MRQSKLFTKTLREPPAAADSVNARLLVQGGFVQQLMAGVYTYLPLGLRVLEKIKTIVRDEMNALGAQELLMPALHPKEPWATTGRWSDPGPEVMFQFKGRGDKSIGLGWTHEEIVTPLAKPYVHSYRDLPFAVYQIQDKFRNEPRAKSGILRGREFSMKDMYSFHADQQDLDAFYDKAIDAYQRVFTRCGIPALLTEASGGAFSKYSHEFQVLAENGEDTVQYCPSCAYAQNKELSDHKAGDACPKCGTKLKAGKAIEVGNIFRLGTRYTDAFGMRYTDAHGKEQPVVMASYGIGPSRVMGAIVEVHYDTHGIRWPASVSPFHLHLVRLGDDASVRSAADGWYERLIDHGYDVLYDDRDDVTVGEKLKDADLLGMPVRLVLSARTEKQGGIEWKERAAETTTIVSSDELLTMLQERLKSEAS